MNSSQLLRRVAPSVRKFSTTAIARSEHDTRNLVGSNLPFSLKNRYLLTLGFTLFFGSGFAVPFLALRHQLLKKNT